MNFSKTNKKLFIKKGFIYVTKFLAFSILVAHFILTFIYVMPVTPIKLKHQNFLNTTIGTFFPQNWSLFAPTPISRNESILVRCLSSMDSIMESETLPEEGWVDVTTPLWKGLQYNRFTAYGRLERTQGNAVRQFIGSLTSLENWRKSCQKGNEKSCKFYKEKIDIARNEAKPKIIKIASSYCAEINGANTQRVAIRIRIDSTLNWSERYSSIKKDETDLEVGIFPINKNVVKPGIYQ